MVSRDSKVDNLANSFFFFLLTIIMSGLLAEIRWSVCMSKSHRSLCVSFSRTRAWFCIYYCSYCQIWISCTFPSRSPCPPSAQTQGLYPKRNLTDFNSEFSSSSTAYQTNAEVPSLPNYLPIAVAKITRLILFPRVLVPCEMQSASSRIFQLFSLYLRYQLYLLRLCEFAAFWRTWKLADR